MFQAPSRGRWLFIRVVVRLTLLLAATRTIAGADAGGVASPPDPPGQERPDAGHRAPVERITVRENASGDDDPGPSGARLDREAIDARPAALEDPLRALGGSAGISSPSDFRCDLRIRGGDSADTLVLLDGLPLPRPYHFSGTPGSAGALGADLVRQVQVWTGGFSAEYGDALAAVVDLSTRELRPDRLTGEGGLNGMQSHLLLRGPAGEGSWTVSGRSADLSLYQDRVGEGGIEGVSFQDFLGALRLQLPGSARLDLIAIGGASGFAQELDASGRASFDSADRAGRTRLEVPIDSRTLLTARAAHDDFTASTFAVAAAGDDEAQRRDDVGVSILRLLSDRHRLSAGAGLTRTRALMLGTVSAGEGSVASRFDGEIRTGGVFAEDLWRPSSAFALRYGMRADRSTADPGSVLSPRLGLEARIDEGLVVRAAAGRFAQFPRPEQIFFAAGDRLETQTADHLILGFERTWAGGGRLSVETFRKWMRHPIGESINRYVDLPELLTRFDSGSARGIDLTYEHAGSGGWRLRIDYSYLIARLEKDGVVAPASADLRHSAALLAGRSLGRGWEISGAFRYQSGLPYSPEVPWTDGVVVGTRTLALDSARLPVYHRLDLRVSRSIPNARGRLAFYLDLLNVYGRMNVRSVELLYDPGTKSFYRRLNGQSPFLPVFGLTVAF